MSLLALWHRWRGAGRGAYGAHDISFLGGLCLLTNNILGSGMVAIPGLFLQAGWLLPTLAFVLIGAWTAVASLYLGRTITKLPGNAGFAQRVEYALLMRNLLPRWCYVLAISAVVLSFIAQNVSNIVVSAQVMDDILLATAKNTCALVLYPPTTPPYLCVQPGSGAIIDDSPFGAGVWTLSIGWVLVAAITVPLSYVSLDSNVGFQVAGVVLIMVCVATWAANFIAMGLSTSAMPVLAPSADAGGSYSSLLPAVLFNFGFVATTPSWFNEKGPGVSTTHTVVLSCVIATLLYLVLGVFGALSPMSAILSPSSAFPNVSFLSVLADPDSFGLAGVWRASQVAVFIFPAANLMTSIPVFSVIVRYNLVNAGIVTSSWAANAIAVGSPWLLSLFFYAGNQFGELVNWSSALLFTVVNLTLPVLLYVRQRSAYAAYAAAAKAAAGGEVLVRSLNAGGGSRGGADADADACSSAVARACARALPQRLRWEHGACPAGLEIELRAPPELEGGWGAVEGFPTDASNAAAAALASMAADADAEGSGGDATAPLLYANDPLEADVDTTAGAIYDEGEELPFEKAEDLRPSPAACRRVCCSDLSLAWSLLAASVVVGVTSLVLQAQAEAAADAQ